MKPSCLARRKDHFQEGPGLHRARDKLQVPLLPGGRTLAKMNAMEDENIPEKGLHPARSCRDAGNRRGGACGQRPVNGEMVMSESAAHWPSSPADCPPGRSQGAAGQQHRPQWSRESDLLLTTAGANESQQLSVASSLCLGRDALASFWKNCDTNI